MERKKCSSFFPFLAFKIVKIFFILTLCGECKEELLLLLRGFCPATDDKPQSYLTVIFPTRNSRQEMVKYVHHVLHFFPLTFPSHFGGDILSEAPFESDASRGNHCRCLRKTKRPLKFKREENLMKINLAINCNKTCENPRLS